MKGYTGTLRANSHGTPCQAREDNAMRVDRYTDGLRANCQVKSIWTRNEWPGQAS